MDGLSAAASILAVIELAGKTASCIIQYSLAVKNANKDICRLQNEVQSLEEVLKQASQICDSSKNGNLPAARASLNAIQECFTELSGLHKKLTPAKRSKLAAVLKLKELKFPFERKEVDHFIKDFERYKNTISLAFQIDQVKIIEDVKTAIDLSKLPSVDSAVFDSFANQLDPQCHEQTRVELRQQIRKWALNPDGKCIFWLNGAAGTGKSTISRTVAQELSSRGQLAASFFFKRGESDRGNASRFITTLAVQLIQHTPRTKPSIADTIAEDPTIASKNLNEQFDKLILQPLSSLEDKTNAIPLIFVVDALDECDNDSHLRLIVKLFSQARTLQNRKLKVFLTSRPELPIRLGFKDISNDSFKELVLHEVSPTIIKHDIEAFIRGSLVDIRKENDELAIDWPGEANLQSLVTMAQPLFISAATICRFVGDSRWDPDKQLETILQYKHLSHTDQLAATYQPVLDQLLFDLSSLQKKTLLQEFRCIVGAIVVLEDSLSTSALSCLLKIPRRTIDRRLATLHSVLNVPSDPDAPVRLFHLSFREFLTSTEYQDNSFLIDKNETHRIIAQHCLTLLLEQACLKQDICSLGKPAIARTEVSEQIIHSCLPSEVRYACVHLIDHLTQAKQPLSTYHSLRVFLDKQFLYWIEALSWLGYSYSLSEMLEKLLQLTSSSDTESLFHQFLHDAKGFVHPIRSLLDTTPLQLYSSGLLFTLESNSLRRMYESHIPSWVEGLPKLQDCWTRKSHLPKGHTHDMMSIALSHNGELLATTEKSNSTIKLWDVVKRILLYTLSGHTSEVDEVVFSPANHRLASCSWDNTVKLWNTSNGALETTLCDFPEAPLSMSFSPDGTYLATLDRSIGVLIRDVETLAIKYNFTNIEFGPFRKMMFSPTWKYLAVSSTSGELSLIDVDLEVQNCEVKSPYEERISWMEFSPVGDLLVISYFNKGPVYVYQTLDGVLRHFFENTMVPALFSTDGLLTYMSTVGEIHRWNPKTDTVQHMPVVWTEYENAFAISRDGMYMALDLDDAIELWNMSTQKSERGLKGDKRSMNLMYESLSGLGKESSSFSPACGSVQLWDTISDMSHLLFDTDDQRVERIEFSPNGELLVAQCYESDIKQIWHTQDGSALCSIIDSSPDFFSHDKYLVVTHWENDRGVLKFNLWNMIDGTLQSSYNLYRSHKDSTENFILTSLDVGSTLRLIYCLNSGIEVHDLINKSLLFTIDVDRKDMSAEWLESSSKYLAMGFKTGTILIYSMVTGELVQKSLEHTTEIDCIAFSKDGQFLAVHSKDKILTLWDMQSGNMKYKLPTPATNVLRGDLVFSTNGMHLLIHETFSGVVTVIDVISGKSVTVVTSTRHHSYSLSHDGQHISGFGSSLVSYVAVWSTASSSCIHDFKIDAYIDRVHFREDQFCLQTDRGVIDLRTEDNSEAPSQALQNRGVFILEHWISVDGEKLLWLPPLFRPTALNCYNDKLVLGFTSGCVLMFDLRLNSSQSSKLLVAVDNNVGDSCNVSQELD